ncbi:MAG: methyltransferase domain-containing protein [Desulfobulbaceae bacterium]|nr:methyltransferase domain-containing protein [Desulfobulbaceae bacterium]
MKKNNRPDLDKQLIADSFRASAATYDDNAIVQNEISRQLINFLQACDFINYSRVLEIGCCTGILTELLVENRDISTIYLNDIVPEFCAVTGGRIAKHVDQVERLPGDIEKCVLPGNLGLVISSATFQWMSDLPGLFRQIHSALRDDGYLVFSIFSPGTMAEMSELTGRSLQYHSRENLTEMLHNNFRVTSLQSGTKRIYFPTVRAVLQHIRQTGVGGIRRTKWLPGKYKEFEKQYKRRFGTDEGLPVTYSSTFVVAKKK